MALCVWSHDLSSSYRRGFTIEQLDEGGDDARLGQHGGTGVIHGDGANHDHNLQDQVVLC